MHPHSPTVSIRGPGRKIQGTVLLGFILHDKGIDHLDSVYYTSFYYTSFYARSSSSFQGLLVSKMYETARGMILNMKSLIDRYYSNQSTKYTIYFQIRICP